MDELKAIETSDNPWLEEAAYQDAMRTLQNALPDISTPLVFSNRDWQPGNFLTQDGEITGFLDFESALFQDPLMGFVKYPIYDLYPLARTDLVRTFLDAQGFSEGDFDHRLALGCLKVLKEEIPVTGSGPVFGTGEEAQQYRDRVLGLLKKACTMHRWPKRCAIFGSHGMPRRSYLGCIPRDSAARSGFDSRQRLTHSVPNAVRAKATRGSCGNCLGRAISSQCDPRNRRRNRRAVRSAAILARARTRRS